MSCFLVKSPEGLIWPPVPVYHGKEIVEQPVVMENLTTSYTEYAKSLLEEYAQDSESPFFLYVSYEEPHIPHFPSPKSFTNTSRRGLYGDVVEVIQHFFSDFFDSRIAYII